MCTLSIWLNGLRNLRVQTYLHMSLTHAFRTPCYRLKPLFKTVRKFSLGGVRRYAHNANIFPVTDLTYRVAEYNSRASLFRRKNCTPRVQFLYRRSKNRCRFPEGGSTWCTSSTVFPNSWSSLTEWRAECKAQIESSRGLPMGPCSSFVSVGRKMQGLLWVV